MHRTAILAGLLLNALGLIRGAPAAEIVENDYFQAHRGGLHEVPENTLAALRHAWAIPGAVPEIDLRTTQDGILVCIHDETPKRTLAAPEEWASRSIREIPLDTLQSWDAGTYFHPQYKKERVPTLDQDFNLMSEAPDRRIYLDLKDVDVHTVYSLARKKSLSSRILFVHGDVAMCKKLRKTYPDVGTMTWLSGSPQKIITEYTRLAEDGFEGVTQLQFHLRSKTGSSPIDYQLGWEFLTRAAKETADRGVALQVRPFEFDELSLHRLRALGIHWYVTDEPRAFRTALDASLKRD